MYDIKSSISEVLPTLTSDIQEEIEEPLVASAVQQIIGEFQEFHNVGLMSNISLFPCRLHLSTARQYNSNRSRNRIEH